MEWPLLTEAQRIADRGTALASSAGTAVAAGAANVKGAWVVIDSATPFDAHGFFVFISSTTSGADSLTDISTGASGSEATNILIDNLFHAGAATRLGWYYYFPVFIPAGTRLTARSQSTTASASVRVQFQLIAAGPLPGGPYSRITTYGANTVDSGGTPVVPVQNADTGTWVELAASLTTHVNFMNFGFGAQLSAVRSTADFMFRFSTGASGSETTQILLDRLWLYQTTTHDQLTPSTFGFPCSIASGKRLAAQLRMSAVVAAADTTDVVAYAVG